MKTGTFTLMLFCLYTMADLWGELEDKVEPVPVIIQDESCYCQILHSGDTTRYIDTLGNVKLTIIK